VRSSAASEGALSRVCRVRARARVYFVGTMSGAPATLGFRELRLRQFRNFTELEQVFPTAGVAIIGENGAGKTNLLESIYYLEILRSFRGAPDEQLVRFGADAFHVRGRYETSNTTQIQELTAAFEARSRRKRVTQNGAEPERLGDALGQLGAVVFSPVDVDIVRGSPGERRRFLDIVLSLNHHGYLHALQRYRHILRSRNAVLRNPRAVDALHAWDEALIETGVQVMEARVQWVAERRAAFARRYQSIGGSEGEIAYECDVMRRTGAADFEAARLRATFRGELERLAERERERGVSLVGPHRDDLVFRAWNGTANVDLRDYGSGGQVRTAAVALRMVEADTIRDQLGRNPLILLDDVFAELDRRRSFRILELLEAEQPGQVILTAPKESDLEVRKGQLAHWRIENGRLSEN
jgi:DNA replication and repair protein RecF